MCKAQYIIIRSERVSVMATRTQFLLICDSGTRIRVVALVKILRSSRAGRSDRYSGDQAQETALCKISAYYNWLSSNGIAQLARLERAYTLTTASYISLFLDLDSLSNISFRRCCLERVVIRKRRNQSFSKHPSWNSSAEHKFEVLGCDKLSTLGRRRFNVKDSVLESNTIFRRSADDKLLLAKSENKSPSQLGADEFIVR